MRKLFECAESEGDFIEFTKISEDKIQLVFDPLNELEYQKIQILTFQDCNDIIKELNYLMAKLG
jgi:hypothetical protein